MNNKFLRVFMAFLFVTATLFHSGLLCQASSESGPIIHAQETTHAFAPVFEGEELSHTFAVLNQGTEDLNIKRVTTS
jgi:hypothetical protein